MVCSNTNKGNKLLMAKLWSSRCGNLVISIVSVTGHWSEKCCEMLGQELRIINDLDARYEVNMKVIVI